MKFYYYIKSHTEFPDFDGELYAKNKKAAIKKFSTLPWAETGLNEEMLKNDFICENCFGKKDSCDH